MSEARLVPSQANSNCFQQSQASTREKSKVEQAKPTASSEVQHTEAPLSNEMLAETAMVRICEFKPAVTAASAVRLVQEEMVVHSVLFFGASPRNYPN